MQVSKPFRVTKVAFNKDIHGVQWAGSELPTPEAWKKLSSVSLAARSADHKLTLIDEALATYHRSRDRSIERLACLSELYFLTDYWLKEAESSQERVIKAREPAIWELFRVVVNCMCLWYQCPVNVLPRVLEETWGRQLTPHGKKVDKPTVKGGLPKYANYLNEFQREQYRLRFKGGLAYQMPWWSWWRISPVLAESKRVGWTDARGAAAPEMMQPGYAGFALTMGREIYMAHHRGSFNNATNFFHSCYAAGDAVLCTGTMLIERGVVRGLCNDSGHYQPTMAHLVQVVQTLQMHAQQPDKIEVMAVPYSWKTVDGQVSDKAWTGTGKQLLTWAAGGRGLKKLQSAGNEQLDAARARFNQMLADKLPKRPPPPPPRPR